MTITAALPAETLAGLLSGVLDDDPGEQAVTDTLLERVDLAAELGALTDGLAVLLAAATAAPTRRAYESDFRHFAGWAAAHGLAALPAAPQTVALYVTAHQDLLRPSSLLRRLSAIAARHRGAGHDSPADHELVRRAVAGLRRRHGTRPAAKAALVTAQLAVICAALQARAAPPPPAPGLPPRAAARARRAAAAAGLRARRDRALLLVGYAAALRRGELVALDVGDLTENDAGLAVFIQRSKTDQEGLGDFVGIAHGHPAGTCTATCPVRAWQEWRDALAAAAGCPPGQLPSDSPAFRPVTRHGRLGTPAGPTRTPG